MRLKAGFVALESISTQIILPLFLHVNNHGSKQLLMVIQAAINISSSNFDWQRMGELQFALADTGLGSERL